MRNAFLLACGLMTVLVLSTAVLSSQFDWAPEDHGAAHRLDWGTVYPYQRNIDWDFAVDPTGAPSPSGAPGADYDGQDDDALKAGDFVELSGDVQWFDGIDLDGYGDYLGLIGVYNDTASDLSGSVKFHIANHAGDDYKNLWIEWDFIVSSGDPSDIYVDTTVLPEEFVTDNGTIDNQRQINPPIPVFIRQNAWSHSEYGPAWEEITADMVVAPGHFFLLDRVHVATESLSLVPEPSTLVLLGLVFIALFVRRRRRS